MTDKIDDGGSAYPSGEEWKVRDYFGLNSICSRGPLNSGMSLRDHFAGLAMQGLLAGQYRGDSRPNMSELVDEAYNVADAMLAARKDH